MGRNVQNIVFTTANVSSTTIGTTGGPALLLTSGGSIQTTSSVVNPQTVNAPLVLEGDLLYLRRYREYERRLALHIRRIAATSPE